jgi:cation:H+ antiporter
MASILLNLLIFFVAFSFVWLGSGLIINSVDKISKKLKVSSFAFSFFLLGILTSIPEISVSLAALSEGKPEIFVGTLIGEIIVIFFLIIPLLAFFGNGIVFTNKIKSHTLLYAFIVLLTPLVAVLDKSISITESIFMIILASVLFFIIQKHKGVLDGSTEMMHLKRYSINDLLKILAGVGIVLVASNIIVDKTIYFADLLTIPEFFIGLIILGVGTSLPEMSLAFRAIAEKKKDVALGNYLGSATTNVIVLSIMIMLSGGNVMTVNSFWKTLLIAVIGFAIFYHFTKSKNDLSKREGAILLLVYVAFLILEGTIIL